MGVPGRSLCYDGYTGKLRKQKHLKEPVKSVSRMLKILNIGPTVARSV